MELGNSSDRDWDEAIRHSQVICNMSMQCYVNKMGTQQAFTAVELAAVLGFPNTNRIYELVDSGEIGSLNRGSGRKRYCVFPRPCVMQYLQRHCSC